MKQFYDKKNAVYLGIILLIVHLFFIQAAVFAAANTSGASLSTIEQIEPLIENSPEAIAATLAVARDEALTLLERQRTGAKYFGGVTFGHSKEPAFETSEYNNSYNKLSVTGGLNFPLLGTLQKEKVRELETEIAVLESQHRSQMLALSNLTALRKAYVTLWIEQQKEEVAKRFLVTEAETVRILQERQAQGLVLPVDSLEFLAVYQDVRRDIAASEMRQTQALSTISLVTGRRWDKPEKLKAPSLPSIAGKQINVTNHPEAVFQSRLTSKYEKLLATKTRLDRDANLTIGVTASRDFPGDTDKGAYIAFSTSAPFKATGAAEQAKLAAANDLSRMKTEEIFVRLKLDKQAEEALATAGYAAADVNARASHLIVMTEAIREKILRRLVLPGDTFEQLQHSKSQYYRTVLAMLDQEEIYLHSAINITSYVYPSGLGSEPMERVSLIDDNNVLRQKLLAPSWLNSRNLKTELEVPMDFSSLPILKNTYVPRMTTQTEVDSSVPAAIPWTKVKAAVYVWDAQPFLQDTGRTMALNEVISAGFSRVLISFTPEQIAQITTPQGKVELDALLVEAKGKGLRVDLLLGDPAWAQTAQRQELLRLIKQLQGFAFDGIHLDIEPDMLPNAAARRAELLIGLADTVQAVKSTTALPVSLSIHPRYLEGELGAVASKKLLPLGLEEVVVMIYSNNSEATIQRMSAIIAAHPNVTFSLAQSVEKNIPAAESYAAYTKEQFAATMRLIEDKLAVQGLKGLVIQAWEDFRKGEA